MGETMPFLPPKMTGNGKFIPPTSIYGDDWGMDAWFMIVLPTVTSYLRCLLWVQTATPMIN